jgi:hypothetical protein
MGLYQTNKLLYIKGNKKVKKPNGMVVKPTCGIVVNYIFDGGIKFTLNK